MIIVEESLSDVKLLTYVIHLLSLGNMLRNI